jgi:hypothetical protein
MDCYPKYSDFAKAGVNTDTEEGEYQKAGRDGYSGEGARD